MPHRSKLWPLDELSLSDSRVTCNALVPLNFELQTTIFVCTAVAPRSKPGTEPRWWDRCRKNWCGPCSTPPALRTEAASGRWWRSPGILVPEVDTPLGEIVRGHL